MNYEKDFLTEMLSKAQAALRAARGLARVLGDLSGARALYGLYVEYCYFAGIAPCEMAF